jgi:hypothetical protein
MKKILFFVLITCLVLALSSCKRTDVGDPPWDGPAGYTILVEGSASPALLVVDGNLHTSRITVRVTDYKGTPLAGRTVLLQQADEFFSWFDLGYFENSEATIKKVTDGNGTFTAIFYVPGETSFPGPDMTMYIRAMLVVDGRVDGLSLPQDYIALMLTTGI